MLTYAIQGLSVSPLKPSAGVPCELSARGLNEGQDLIPAGQARMPPLSPTTNQPLKR